jgi:hypothetical protein
MVWNIIFILIVLWFVRRSRTVNIFQLPQDWQRRLSPVRQRAVPARSAVAPIRE